MVKIPFLSLRDISRFWSKVHIPDYGTECWLWTGELKKGYGRFRLCKWTYLRAHRVAYHLEVGVANSIEVVRHTCDVTHCCNPAHLLGGTQLDNVKDRVERGRSARGSKMPHAAFTVAQVLFIRQRVACGSSFKEVADELGKTFSAVYGAAVSGWPECRIRPIPVRRRKRDV